MRETEREGLGAFRAGEREGGGRNLIKRDERDTQGQRQRRRRRVVVGGET